MTPVSFAWHRLACECGGTRVAPDASLSGFGFWLNRDQSALSGAQSYVTAIACSFKSSDRPSRVKYRQK